MYSGIYRTISLLYFSLLSNSDLFHSPNQNFINSKSNRWKTSREKSIRYCIHLYMHGIRDDTGGAKIGLCSSGVYPDARRHLTEIIIHLKLREEKKKIKNRKIELLSSSDESILACISICTKRNFLKWLLQMYRVRGCPDARRKNLTEIIT